MLKKPVCWSFTMVLFLITAAKSLADDTSLSTDSSQVTTFPSKTYFLMVVDRYLMKHIQRDDVARLLEIEDMDPVDEFTIYHGVRKAMLKSAARRWDAGEVSSFNGDVARMMGWNTADTDSESWVQNRLFLFRYAQDSEKSKLLLQQYSEQMNKGSRLEGDSFDCYQHMIPTLDYDFYRTLVKTNVSHLQALDLALRYESLSPAQRCSVVSSLETDEYSVNERVLAQSLAQARSINNQSLTVGYSN